MCRIMFLVLLLLPVAAFAGTPTAAQILAHCKVASGGSAWDAIHSLRIRAVEQLSNGPSGTYDVLVDFRSGRRVSHFKVGSNTIIAMGFDGKSNWEIVFGHVVDQGSSPNVTLGYIDSYDWWYPRRAPAAIKLLGKRFADAAEYWVVQIAPEHGNPFDLWINAKTQLVGRIVQASGTGKSTTYYSDYRTAHGIKIAFRLREVSMVQGIRSSTNVSFKQVSVNEPVSAKDFTVPRQE